MKKRAEAHLLIRLLVFLPSSSLSNFLLRSINHLDVTLLLFLVRSFLLLLVVLLLEILIDEVAGLDSERDLPGLSIEGKDDGLDGISLSESLESLSDVRGSIVGELRETN